MTRTSRPGVIVIIAILVAILGAVVLPDLPPAHLHSPVACDPSTTERK